MPPETQAKLRRLQALVRHANAQPGTPFGGTLGIGIEQRELNLANLALARTIRSTWMKVKRSESQFEVWNGTPEDIRKQAQAKPQEL